MMAFHKSNLGKFGDHLDADLEGYVPTAETGPWELTYTHSHPTHDDNGNLTEYGKWWEEDGFSEIRAESVAAADEAVKAVERWQAS